MSGCHLGEGAADDLRDPERKAEAKPTHREDAEILASSPDHVYEDLSDRKGTLYEEVDDSSPPSPPPAPPPLPERPQDLEIPESLHLKKLSNSIRQTLEATRLLPTQGACPKLRVIQSKKVKEVGRIMQLGHTELDVKPK